MDFLIEVGGAVLLVFLLVMFVLSRIKVAKSNEAFIVKIGGHQDATRAAAQRFLHQQKEIEGFTREVLAGALRSIVGRLTIEEIIRDRAAFASAVAEEPRPSGGGAGAHGRHDRRGHRPLAQAERDQAILSEQQKVAERNAEIKERRLNTEVRKPADAARYKVEQEAEEARDAAVFVADAQRRATIAAAQARSEQDRLLGEGEQRRRTSVADAVEREGVAEGAALLARGQADAGARRLKAEAFARYGEAAVLGLLVQVLPQVVEPE